MPAAARARCSPSACVRNAVRHDGATIGRITHRPTTHRKNPIWKLSSPALSTLTSAAIAENPAEASNTQTAPRAFAGSAAQRPARAAAVTAILGDAGTDFGPAGAEEATW